MTQQQALALLDLAVAAARQSPCQKSKRGVALVTKGNKVATGFNHPPAGFACDAACLASGKCAQSAIHAEVDAMSSAEVWYLTDAELVHVKVVDGKPVPSGGPSCVECSKSILHAGCAAVWLLHEDGLRRYPAEEFHRLSLRARGLPGGDHPVTIAGAPGRTSLS